MQIGLKEGDASSPLLFNSDGERSEEGSLGGEALCELFSEIIPVYCYFWEGGYLTTLSVSRLLGW
jgi:hypothetical protein